MLAAPPSRLLEDQPHPAHIVWEGTDVAIPATSKILVFVTHRDQEDNRVKLRHTSSDCTTMWIFCTPRALIASPTKVGKVPGSSSDCSKARSKRFCLSHAVRLTPRPLQTFHSALPLSRKISGSAPLPVSVRHWQQWQKEKVQAAPMKNLLHFSICCSTLFSKPLLTIG